MVDNLLGRAESLMAKIQGAPITAVKVGQAVITSAKIANLAVGTAQIAGGAITSAKINSLNASKVTAGTISSDRIGAGTITASKLSASTLSAISADFGTLTAGSINGITITAPIYQTSSGDDRIRVNGSTMFFYDNDVRRAQFQNNAVFLWGAGIGFAESGGSGLRAVFGVSSSTGNLVMGTTNCPLILFQALGDESVIIKPENGDVILVGDVKVNGSTKSAIVETSKGFKTLYCVESPEVWFFDLAESFDEIDPLFWEVTEGEVKTVTNSDGQVLVFRKRKGFAKIRFELKTKQEYLRNDRFWNQQYSR